MTESTKARLKPHQGALDPELMDGLVQTSFAVMAVLTRAGSQHDLSLTQVRLLGILRDRQPKMAELAGYLGLDKSTVSGLVDRAERRGLVQRRMATDDGRSVRVCLSTEGARLTTEVGAEIAHLLTPLLTPLTAAERQRMRHSLALVVQAAPAASRIGEARAMRRP
jgi:DNA-binding MarR family transcriptional regulator